MVMNPLKLSVYRYQYELLLDCVKYLTSGGGEDSSGSHAAATTTEPVRKTSVPHAQSSVETAGRQFNGHLSLFQFLGTFFTLLAVQMFWVVF